MTKITDTYRKLRPLIIDDIRSIASVAGSGGSTSTGGVTDHGQLTGLTPDDDHPQYLTVARADARYALSEGSASAGAGLTYADGAYNVGAGNGITVNADDVALAASVAGAGLAYSSGVLDIGAGNGITVNTNDVALATGVAGDGLAWQSAGVLKVGAGNGLTAAADTINVGVSGLGLSVGADAVVLASSSNPGAAAAILATDSSGVVQLEQVKVGATPGVTLFGTNNIATGPDLQFASNGLIAAEISLYINLDSGNSYSDSTALIIGKNAGTSAATELFRLTESGRLGIGNNAPSYALDVTGAGRITGNFYAGTMLTVDESGQVVGVGVTPDGAATLDVKAKTNADHTVRIAQKSGQSGRLWRIEDTAGDELIVLDSQGNLQSGQPGFVSGLTGWQITPTGTAEFNNVWVRGELHASIFVMDEFHSNGGTFVTATAGKLENDAILSATSDVATTNCRSTAFAETSVSYRYNDTETGDNAARSIENWIEITDPPSGHAILFTRGQVLRCKTFTGTDVYDLWLRVNSSVDMTDYYRYHVQVMSGTYTTLPAGSAVIRYGEEGDGLILQTADLQYAPYLDIFTVGPEVWSGAAGAIIPHVRLGRLDGVGLPGISGIEQYGMVAGTDLSDANSPYFVASNTQIASYRIPSTWNDGTNNTVKIESDGHVMIGTNVDTEAGVAFDFDPLNGVLRVGNSTYGGQILIYGDGDGLTNIDGGNIQTGTITADKITADTITASQIAAATITATQIAANTITASQIASGTITTTQLNFTPVQTSNVVASINATAEGIRIAGNRITIDGDVTFSSGYNPTTKITAGGAAADVNANVTTISGGKITANSVTADRMSVSTLSAIVADLGAITAGSIVVGSTNKLWLNDSADGALNIGGATKASAPFKVAATGALTATDVVLSGSLNISGTGATISGAVYAGGSPAAVKISSDGERLKLSDVTGVTVSTNAAALRWFPDLDGTHDYTKNYTGMLSYRHTSSKVVDMLLTSFVGSTDYDEYGARVVLQAGHQSGSSSATYVDSRLEITYEADPGGGKLRYVGGWAEFDSSVKLIPRSGTPSGITEAGESRMYTIGDKFVIAYVDGATVRYLYIALSGTGTTWTHSTSAPS